MFDIGCKAITQCLVVSSSQWNNGGRKRKTKADDELIARLEQVIEFYNRGGDFYENGHAGAVRPLKLTIGEKEALVAFLRSLTDERVLGACCGFVGLPAPEPAATAPPPVKKKNTTIMR